MHNLPILSLSMVSHELKNPLTLIQGTLQLIECHYPEIQNDPLWTQVLADVHYMSKLLSEITSINSIQNINYSRINIRQVLTNVVYSFSANSEIQGKNIRIEYKTDILWIEADLMIASHWPKVVSIAVAMESFEPVVGSPPPIM